MVSTLKAFKSGGATEEQLGEPAAEAKGEDQGQCNGEPVPRQNVYFN